MELRGEIGKPTSGVKRFQHCSIGNSLNKEAEKK